MSLLVFYPQLSIVRQALKGSRERVFLVGGAIRDYYLKRQGTDFDFAVDHGAIALSRQLARRIKGAFVLLDDEHGSARVVKKQNHQIDTIQEHSAITRISRASIVLCFLFLIVE